MLLFGGVFDEDIEDEFIQGTCSNEMHLYKLATNKWASVEYSIEQTGTSAGGSGEEKELCPRFNAMMTTARNGSIYAFGGIWEIGDVQYTLDSLYEIRVSDSGVLVRVLQPISVDLSDWQERLEAERREMMASDSDDGSDDSDDDSDSDSDLDDESDSDSEEERMGEKDDGSDCPVINPKKHKSLKEYFDDSSAHWLDRAKQDNPVGTEKDLRKSAFLLAKQHWDQSAILESVGRL